MAVENHINAVDDDQRNDDSGSASKQRVGLHDLLFLLRLSATVEVQQQDEYSRSGGVEHMGFAQGIEGTVVQNHTGHHVDGAGFGHAFFHIALHHLVVGGGVRGTEGGQICHRQQQKADHNAAEHHGKDRIDLPETADFALLQPVHRLQLPGVVGVSGVGIGVGVILGQGSGEVKFAGVPGFQPGANITFLHFAPSFEFPGFFSG